MPNADDLIKRAKANRVESLKRSLAAMPNRQGKYYVRRRQQLTLELELLEHELFQYDLFNSGDTVRAL
jgi:hypothetical protein